MDSRKMQQLKDRKSAYELMIVRALRGGESTTLFNKGLRRVKRDIVTEHRRVKLDPWRAQR